MTNNKFTVVNHTYLNTGGNTMVSIFTVYDRLAFSTRYVVANDEGFNWQAADTITNEQLRDMMDNDPEFAANVIIGHFSWGDLTSEPAPFDPHFTEEEFELFKYCEYEFYKQDCKYFDRKVFVAAHQLPNNLYGMLTDECIKWHEDNHCDFLTDGYMVYVNSEYEDYVREQSDRELQDIKDFKKWFDTLCSEENLDRLYDTYITICVDGNSVKIPFGAQPYNLIDDLLEDTIKEW